jgi:L-amino acid N-acyltransferase YncA
VSPIIRVASTDDAASVAEIYGPSVTENATSFEVVAPDASEMSSRISKILPQYPWLVCEAEGQVIGYAYASAHRDRAAYRWSVDVSAYISTKVHRRGVGTALYAALFEILVLQRYRNAYAGITLPNSASEGMHGRAGFSLVGVYHHVGYKFGVWHDVGWYERSLLPPAANPLEPISFADIRESKEVGNALARGQSLLKKLS